MTFPLTVLQHIEAYARWSATGKLVACARGSEDIQKLRNIRSGIRAGFHGLAMPWTSMQAIAEFAGLLGSARLVQTEKGTEVMKLVRAVTALRITSNYWREYAQEWRRPVTPPPRDWDSDSDDADRAMWRRWVGDD